MSVCAVFIASIVIVTCAWAAAISPTQPIGQCRARVIATQTGQGCCEPDVNACDYTESIVASDCAGACPIGRTCVAAAQELDVVWYYRECEGGCPSTCNTVAEVFDTGWVILDCDCHLET